MCNRTSCGNSVAAGAESMKGKQLQRIWQVRIHQNTHKNFSRLFLTFFLLMSFRAPLMSNLWMFKFCYSQNFPLFGQYSLCAPEQKMGCWNSAACLYSKGKQRPKSQVPFKFTKTSELSNYFPKLLITQYIAFNSGTRGENSCSGSYQDLKHRTLIQIRIKKFNWLARVRNLIQWSNL